MPPSNPHTFAGGHAQGFGPAKSVTAGMTSTLPGTSRTAGKVIAIASSAAVEVTLCRVDAATGEGRHVTMMEPTEQRGSSAGSVMYRVTERDKKFVDDVAVVCALDGNIFGSGLFDLTPMHRTFVAAAMRSRAAAAQQAEASGILLPSKRNEPPGGVEEGCGAPKIARVTDLYTALGRNTLSVAPSGIRDEQMAIWGLDAKPRDFSTAERKLWTKQERSMFAGQSSMHGQAHASAFMRDYFRNNGGQFVQRASRIFCALWSLSFALLISGWHVTMRAEGKPLQPQRPPKQGAFSLYKAEQVELLGCSAAGFKGTDRRTKNYNSQVRPCVCVAASPELYGIFVG